LQKISGLKNYKYYSECNQPFPCATLLHSLYTHSNYSEPESFLKPAAHKHWQKFCIQKKNRFAQDIHASCKNSHPMQQ